jgi:GDPmannose 4,6-dehydratase
MQKTALIYGVSGQDGSYLSALLVSKGYKVAGVARQGGFPDGVQGIVADLAGPPEPYLDPISSLCPQEIYNLAAVSSPPAADADSRLAERVNAGAPKAMLARVMRDSPKSRFFQASSAYVYSGSRMPVNEESAPAPLTEYGRAKLAAQRAVAEARFGGAFACSGILFNHESPRRGENFVTRKISLGVAKIKLGLADRLVLGNLDARRDWGFAGDYVEAMWLMLQQKQPDDYVIATGEAHSVRDFCREAFACAGLDYEKHVESSPAYMRPSEVDLLIGDPGKARASLGWKPKVGFQGLVRMMVEADLAHVKGFRQA